MFVYAVAPAANQATSGSANTEVDALAIIVGVRNVAIQALYAIGKAAGATTLTGIAFRLKRWTTASTAGSAITPQPRDPGAQASKCSAASGPTQGTGDGAVRLAFGCGVAGPGGWVAPNSDSMPVIEGGSGDSLDVYSVSAGTSLNFELSAEVVE
jgi:hypothetical protein